MKDQATNRSRGFGFVQFDSSEPVERVMADYAIHTVEGKWVEVKRSIPREQMPPSAKGGKCGKGKGGAWGGWGGGCGGGWGGCGGAPAWGGCGGFGKGYGAVPPPAFGYGAGRPGPY
eukprot:SRR837773.20912.p3 GENE.SRR837773.20912~~SRR837773.20912.p3  ORF type:complete len:134 (-),score=57.24 SRR837773.20912:89-439(-)